jgi:hypothetical protein
MSDKSKPFTTIVDYATGRKIPCVGAEENRQRLEKFLVEKKGFARRDLRIDEDLALSIQGKAYRSQVDLVVRVGEADTAVMAFKCCAASPGSREREIVSAARLLEKYQIPFAVASDGRTATVLDTLTGRKIGEGLEAVPSKSEALKHLSSIEPQPLAPEKVEREKLIFRTYDMENVNVSRNL